MSSYATGIDLPGAAERMFEAVFRRFLKTAMLLVAACAPAIAAGPMTRIVDFSKTPGAVTITGNGAEVRLTPITDPADDRAIDVSATIQVTGYPIVAVTEGVATSSYYKRWVGIGRLAESDPAPSVLIAGFSGGAHCCATLKAIVPYEGRLRVLEFEAVDGEPEEAFPRDIDHDGVVDFVRQDDRFRYEFAGGAGSWCPPLVFNIRQGQIVDVTTRHGFRYLWEDYAREARIHCADQSNEDRNGACAAYVAAAARLGRYAEAMREVQALARRGDDITLPQGCRVARVDEECPAGNEVAFNNFASALSWFLRAHGYID
jgi:hypothetical protein